MFLLIYVAVNIKTVLL